MWIKEASLKTCIYETLKYLKGLYPPEKKKNCVTEFSLVQKLYRKISKDIQYTHKSLQNINNII